MIKHCKLCEKDRYANSSYCFFHYRERERVKKAEKARLKKERHEASKGFKESLRKSLHKKAWKLMSEVVRRTGANSDGYNECYTCLAVKHYKEMNAGHYKHDRLDFDFRNIHCQCVKCNQHNSGELDLYAERLIRENGLEWFNQLVRDSWTHPGYSVEDLTLIIEELKNKLVKIYK